jgi:hypothetical protein
MSAALKPLSIKVGEEATLSFTFSPSGCISIVPPDPAWIRLDADVVSKAAKDNSAVAIRGERGGQASVTVESISIGVNADGTVVYSSAQTLAVTVTAQPCTSVSITYPHQKFDTPGSERSDISRNVAGEPVLTYSPIGCTRPLGNPRYSSLDKKFEVDATKGTIDLHPARSTAQYTFITVTHGSLNSDVKVGDD